MKELRLKLVHILPSHQYGSNKYEHLKRDYALREVKAPSHEEVNSINAKFEQNDIKAVISG